MKKLFLLALCTIAPLALYASDYDKDNSKGGVWGRKKYTNLSWVNQTLTDMNSPGNNFKSNFGGSIATGKTYYFHKKPILGLMKIGFDWTMIDINYAKYSDGNSLNSGIMTKSGDGFDDIITEDKPVTSFLTKDWGKNQVDLAMHFGASLTVNPVDFLKLKGYFRFAPTLSGIVSKGEGADLEEMLLYGGYGSLWVSGIAVSYKVISLGIERRWGNVSYRSITAAEDISSFLGGTAHPMSINSTRIYLGFQLGK